MRNLPIFNLLHGILHLVKPLAFSPMIQELQYMALGPFWEEKQSHVHCPSELRSLKK